MNRHEELEQRLAKLSLNAASEKFENTGRLALQQLARPNHPWAVRLNYALAASLLLSIGANLIQFTRTRDELTTASQCEVSNETPDSAYSPTRKRTDFALEALKTEEALPAFTARLC